MLQLNTYIGNFTIADMREIEVEALTEVGGVDLERIAAVASMTDAEFVAYYNAKHAAAREQFEVVTMPTPARTYPTAKAA